MRASNPTLNDKVFNERIGIGTEVLTIGDVVRASLALLTILLITGALGWQWIGDPGTQVSFPVWFWVALLGGFGVGILTAFKPDFAPVTAPVYAALEGLFVGALSRVFEFEFDGIVLQAVGLTLAVFAVLLAIYSTGVINVTDNFRLGVVAATGAIALIYVVSIGLSLFGLEMPYLHDTGPIGIGISVVIVIVASLNLVLDFDFIENAVDSGAPKQMRWYASFGLLVTIVWLYLEMLRLLAKIRSN